MPRTETFRVDGYRDFMRAIARADRETKRAVRTTLRTVGEHVRVDATVRFAATDSRSAAGFKTRVRQRGVAVEQSLRKTTGKHPGYGALQMRRALLPALTEQAPETERAMERALDEVCDHFNR